MGSPDVPDLAMRPQIAYAGEPTDEMKTAAHDFLTAVYRGDPRPRGRPWGLPMVVHTTQLKFARVRLSLTESHQAKFKSIVMQVNGQKGRALVTASILSGTSWEELDRLVVRDPVQGFYRFGATVITTAGTGVAAFARRLKEYAVEEAGGPDA